MLNADNALTAAQIGKTGAEEIVFSLEPTSSERSAKAMICDSNGVITVNGEPFLRCADIRLPGHFNIANYMCAIGLTLGYAGHEDVTALAKSFGGVEHRNEFVRECGGVKYYNSSIDSSPSRTMAALGAYPQKPILICGGRDKHVPFDSLASEILRRAKALILTGEAKDQILAAVQNAPEYKPGKLPILIEEDFTNAVQAARTLAAPGDTVLLSPACTSFDAFCNFEARGQKFKEIVNAFQD